MIKESHKTESRENYKIRYNKDLIIVGGGLAGTCAAITAARSGIKVVLVQDRPVLGGNSSSEVRLWILGATSHMGNNNRWAREGGVVDEILIENLYRNKEGNAIILDTILLEKVTNEPNITLLLNTAVFEVKKKDENTLESVRAFCSQTSTEYLLSAPLFIDSSGDGIVGFLAGAPFRMGAETKDEFGELFAPDKEYGEMLGHTIYFYSKDTGHPVKYVPPAFALKDIKDIPRYKTISSKMNGCQFWWFEYGGRYEDTVKETEKIKWELWKVVYGAWDYIKNSGKFPDAENLTLEWVGTIPGKRESRRFEGEYLLKQQDLVEQRQFHDAVAFGGWSLDLHPADGVYSKLPGCNQWHTKGIYQIPYRSLICKTINNLFFAGRIISATHIAFASTRVMATSAHGAQAAALAAVICAENGINTKEVLEPKYLANLQNRLNLTGQSIPCMPIDYAQLPVEKPKIKASSTYELNEMPFDGDWVGLEAGFAQLLPLKSSKKYEFKILVKAQEECNIEIQLRKSSKAGNYTPDVELEKIEIQLGKGNQFLTFSFETTFESDEYAFLLLMPTKHVKVKTSEQRLSGTLSLFRKMNKAVSNFGKQEPPEGLGVDSFEFWTPKRRPDGKNLAFTVSPSINLFNAFNIANGFVRPWLRTNAWAASLDDSAPELILHWEKPQKINKISLYFDTDYDHPLESVLMVHPEEVIPFCVRNYRILDRENKLLFEKSGNYQTINHIEFEQEIECSELKFQFEHPSSQVPATVFEIVCTNTNPN
jgi:hypothetical protein